MTERLSLAAFLTTDPRDVGCDEAMRALHTYVDLYVEAVAAGDDPGMRYPGIAVHLAACGPCGADFDGLLAAVTALDSAHPEEHGSS